MAARSSNGAIRIGSEDVIYPRIPLYLTWIASLCAVFGSLHFSLVMKFPPCDLCWYQRIFVYPLAILIPLGIVREDRNLPLYALSLLWPGFLIALYHNALYYDFLEKPIVPCSEGVSCTSRDLELFGFIGIPLMSLVAFCLMIGLVTWAHKRSRKL